MTVTASSVYNKVHVPNFEAGPQGLGVFLLLMMEPLLLGGEASSFRAHPLIFTSSTNSTPKHVSPLRQGIHRESGHLGAVLCQLLASGELGFLKLERNVQGLEFR